MLVRAPSFLTPAAWPALVFLVGGAACAPDEAPPTTAGPGTGAVTFSAAVSLMRERCAPCHTTDHLGVFRIGTTAADDRTAHQELVGPARGSLCIDQELQRVVPGNAERSLVASKLRARLTGADPPCGGGMPPTERAALPLPEIELIERWIVGGAPGPDSR